MSYAEKLLTIDRRVIYVLVFVVTIIPFIVPVDFKMHVTDEVQSVYDLLEGLPEGSTIMLAADYDPQTMAENGPQAEVLLRHMFKKNLKVVISTLSQDGAALVEMLIQNISEEYDKKNGIDYAYLGYKPYPAVIIMAMGQDFRLSYPADYYNVKLDDLPIMQNVKNYDDVEAIVQIGGGNVSTYWITYAHERYKAKLALAVTAVSGPQYYANLDAGQIFGLLGGLKGAAEYESLLRDEYKRLGVTLRAIQGMNVQNFVHILIVLFTIVGNVAFFMTRRSTKKGV